MKLPIFWKKYGIYIIIGSIIGLILGLVLWLNKKDPVEIEKIITPIDSPFEYLDDTISFSEIPTNISVLDEIKIYKTTKPGISVIERFVSKFTNELPNITESMYMWRFKDVVITYSLDTSILYINSTEGLVTDLKISGVSDIASFLLEYFDIRDIVVTDFVILSDDRREYLGYYSMNNIEYGSLGINGYALRLVADSSKLYSISILVLPTSNVVAYQDMPTRSLAVAIEENHEIYKTFLSYDENFDKQYPLIRASAQLKSVEISNVNLRYIFLDQTYGYILPMYEIKGDGQLQDSQTNKYWADTLLYISALNSEYVNRVEPYMETNILLDSGE